MLTPEQKIQFNEILEELGRTLDITETQYNAAVKSYEAVGLHLAKHNSLLAPYNPEILPQGSFLLGTMIKPVNETDDLDIDLVCQLTGKQQDWCQFDLKQKVGDQLKSHQVYRDMLQPEGRRCWTLKYAETANYHLDILPCIVNSGFRILLEKAFGSTQYENIEEIALRITDRKEENYYSELNHLKWLKSNPFGYGRWFLLQSSLGLTKSVALSESVQPVPEYKAEKLPLQRVVQILKRHRDIMFDGSKEKPISIIITTLAAKAYQKETDIISALLNAIERIPSLIEQRYSERHERMVKWIVNPINPEENFADKWAENPVLEKNFYSWLRQLKEDVANAIAQRGLHRIQESLEPPFGRNAVSKVFNDLGDKARTRTEQGANRFSTGLGISTLGTNIIKPHSFHGDEE